MPNHSKRSKDTEAKILEALKKGTPLAVVCREQGMPDPSTWRDWCAADEDLAIAYARARDEGFDTIALDALSILDEEPERVVTVSGDDRSESRIDSASVQRAKNRFEGRLKLLAKWDPKRYGDKIAHVGGDPESGDRPIQVSRIELVAGTKPGE